MDAFTLPFILFNGPNFGNGLIGVFVPFGPVGVSCLLLGTKDGVTTCDKVTVGDVCFVFSVALWHLVVGMIAVVMGVDGTTELIVEAGCASFGDGLLCITNRCSISCSYIKSSKINHINHIIS